MYCSHCGCENLDIAKYCVECGVLLKDPTIPCGSFLDHGRYEVKKLIKAGGMGAVYLVQDHRLGNLHALKEMVDFSPTPADRNKAVERFKNEAAILSALSHPSLPKVTNYFVEGGHYYMVMSFIEGQDLESILRERGNPGLPEELVKHVGIEICKILEYMHAQSPPVLNRDIKPSNIMVDQREKKIYLIDFGIAKTISPSSYKKTAIGTEGYAPLEQYRGYPEPRSDIYALGATMYHLITGVEVNPLDFPPVRTINPEVSRFMENILVKALAMYPDDRFANSSEMRKSLQSSGKPVTIKGQSSSKLVDPARVISDVAPSQIMDYGKEKASRIRPPVKKTYKHVVIVSTSDKMEMVHIEGGEFLMGTPIDDRYATFASRDEMPVHSFSIHSFYIDIHPVTNRQFLIFVQATGYETTSELRGDLESWKTFYTSGKDNHPVVYVSWYDACEYAAWAQKRLPTEAEWEKASRGVDGITWPWGDDFDPGRLNCFESGIMSTTEVTRFPGGRSPYGAYDMAGNVREWTSDWYRPYPYNGPYSMGYLKAIRGGSFSDKAIDSRCAKRWENVPAHRDHLKGFRCARSADNR